MARFHVRWAPKRRQSWVVAFMFVPVTLAVFVVLRLVGPGLNTALAALIAAVIAVALVRGGQLAAQRSRRRPLGS